VSVGSTIDEIRRVTRELRTAEQVEFLLADGLAPNGAADGLDDASRARALARIREVIDPLMAEMIRLYKILFPPRSKPVAEHSAPPTFTHDDTLLDWRVRAGLAGAGPPRPESSEPRQRLDTLAGLKSRSEVRTNASDLKSEVTSGARGVAKVPRCCARSRP
jgi:hypothetical protein